MKKVLSLVLILALVLSLTMVSLVACDKDKDDNAAEMSNSEVLATSAVMLANTISSGGTTSAEEETSFKAGLNLELDLSGLGLGAMTTIAETALSGVMSSIDPFQYVETYLTQAISAATVSIGDNDIKIEKDEDAENENTYNVTIKETKQDVSGTVYQDESKFIVIIDVDKNVDIENSTSFEYNIELYADYTTTQTLLFTFSGTATYSDAKDALEFVFGEYGSTLVAKAYAKESGFAFQLTIGDEESTFNASATVELNDGSAKIDLSGSIKNFGSVSGNFTIATTSDIKSLSVAGSFNVSITNSAIISYFQDCVALEATANLNGTAQFSADNGYELGMSGKLALTKA